MENKENTGVDVIRTFVKGIRIELTSDFLAQILNVPNNGPPVVYNQFDKIFSDPDYSLIQATRSLQYFMVQTGSRSSILPTHITLIDRLICYFISENIVLPKSSNNELRNLDVYIIDKLLIGLGAISAIPVATIMIVHMCYVTRIASGRNAKHHAPFAIIISRILAVMGVDLSGETSFAPTAKSMLTAQVMTDLYFIYRQSTWYRNPDSRNLNRHARDPRIPPPTAEERAHEAQVQEEVALDHADQPHAEIPLSTKALRGTRGVYSAIFFYCLDNLSSRMALLEHHTMTHTYSLEIHAPPYDISALDDIVESESTTDDE